MASAVCMCGLPGPIDAPLSIVSLTSACGSDITQKEKIEGKASSVVHTEWSPLCVVDWQQESPKSSADVLLLWVRNLQQEWDLLFFLLQSPWLSAICLSSHIIPQSAQNYWPWCAVSWDCGCSFLLSTSGDILVIAEIAEQNENIIDFIKFRVLTDSSRLPAATC